jgi:phosphotransferase system  glucose/maltose/N-acetylglucosamine-specific IIC component
MPSDGPPPVVAFAVVAALGVVVCCGLPVLLSVGVGITVAGLGLRSWLLVLVGVVLAGSAALWRNRRQVRGATPTTGWTGR